MDITIKIEAPALEDAIHALAVAIAGNIELLLEGTGSRAATVSVEMPVSDKPEIKEETAASTADDTAASAEKSATTITIDQVRALFVEKNSAGNRDKLKQILSDFNVKKVTDLQEKDFAAVVARLEEL
jgi:hypothetical protein